MSELRTLNDMTAQVRRLVNDVHDGQFDPVTVDQALRDALEAVTRDLVADPIGQRLLRTHQAAQSFTKDTETYDKPADAIQVDRVEYRSSGSDAWKTAEYRPPQRGKTPPPVYWFDDAGLTQIRIWPAFTSVSDQQYRMRYYAWPQFPQADEGTFDDPAASGTDTYHYPRQMDRVVEYQAAILLVEQENLNTVPVQYFQNQYSAILSTIIRGVPGTYPDREVRRPYTRQNQEDD